MVNCQDCIYCKAKKTDETHVKFVCTSTDEWNTVDIRRNHMCIMHKERTHEDRRTP